MSPKYIYSRSHIHKFKVHGSTGSSRVAWVNLDVVHIATTKPNETKNPEEHNNNKEIINTIYTSILSLTGQYL